MRDKTTIKDIARLAEASPSTVSAVLNDTWQGRRISAETAERVRRIALAQGYRANLQARGLRHGRSGLAGLVLPLHDNRFFAGLSQAFEAEARARGLSPVVVSTRRDPEEERRAVGTLLAHAVDALVIAGTCDPAGSHRLCAEARAAHVFVDLPGIGAPSVVSDNRGGAERLTAALMDAMRPGGSPWFLGGRPGDHATAERIAGFRAETARRGCDSAGRIIACGYTPARARAEIAALCDRLGGLPDALFVNSIMVFAGVLEHLVTLPPEAFAGRVVGCYDYDPFAAFLQFPVHMIRQDAAGLIGEAFRLLDRDARGSEVIAVPPELVPPRTIPQNPFADLG
ncbi:MAG: LacI family DNA-binding transcriptional regulator [Rhodobacteraceae bacterium]|nr:LacI family DNA-binding transcriptional regulator [Paracoccaceae bacterium]